MSALSKPFYVCTALHVMCCVCSNQKGSLLSWKQLVNEASQQATQPASIHPSFLTWKVPGLHTTPPPRLSWMQFCSYSVWPATQHSRRPSSQPAAT